MLEEKELNENSAKYKEYTMQEILAEYVDAYNPNHFDFSSGGVESTQEKYKELAKELRSVIISKIKGDDPFFVLMNNTTNMPHVDYFGRVLICSSAEIVEITVNEFKHQFIDLSCIEVTKQDKPMFFNMLFELNGIDKIVLDGGTNEIELSKDELWKKRISVSPVPGVPLKNPDLVFAMVRFEQERRWRVSYPDKPRRIQQYESDFIDQIVHAKFIIPARKISEEIVNGVQNVQFEIPRLNGDNGTFATPIFTDIDRMQSVFGDHTDVLVWGIEEMLTGAQDPFFVINCNEAAMVIDKNFIQHVLDTKVNSMLAN